MNMRHKCTIPPQCCGILPVNTGVRAQCSCPVCRGSCCDCKPSLSLQGTPWRSPTWAAWWWAPPWRTQLTASRLRDQEHTSPRSTCTHTPTPPGTEYHTITDVNTHTRTQHLQTQDPGREEQRRERWTRIQLRWTKRLAAKNSWKVHVHTLRDVFSFVQAMLHCDLLETESGIRYKKNGGHYVKQ